MKQSIFTVLLLSCSVVMAQKNNYRSAISISITVDKIEQKVIECTMTFTKMNKKRYDLE